MIANIVLQCLLVVYAAFAVLGIYVFVHAVLHVLRKGLSVVSNVKKGEP